MSEVVTEADLTFGWDCESCRCGFHVGDQAFGVPVGFTSDGTLIEGEYRCQSCFVADRPVEETQ